MTHNIDNIGWNFDNSYIHLPNNLMSKIKPIKVKLPKLEILNYNLAKELDLNFKNNTDQDLALIFSGNKLPIGSEAIAQAYAGHQFGYFTNLGDGRAHLIGEHLNKKKQRFDIQFKGSGKTPYSRNGDGRAALGPMLREYLISEAMNSLNIPTTRSLAVVSTGENILRERYLKGAILTRTASSHIRVGTFQYLASLGNIEDLKKLFFYTIERHYSEIKQLKNPAVALLNSLMDRQISLTINWMRVGFIHGVMNTDNVTLSGETIDYGPCAFMDYYHPNTVFSSIDQKGRYSFMNQEIVCHWNISRFAETLIPFFAENEKESIEIGREIIDQFPLKFKTHWIEMMKNKLGFIGDFNEDKIFIDKLLLWMEKNNADYTNTFLYLMNNKEISDEVYNNDEFINLYYQWKERINKNLKNKDDYLSLMQKNNPKVIPRNYLVESALHDASENDDYNKFNKILDLIKNPYDNNINEFNTPSPISFNKNYKTYCGT